MRLSTQERAIIKQTVSGLDAEAQVYLFGSRVDDAKKGGDIDLLIMSGKLRQAAARTIRAKLFQRLDEQKIDITIAQDASAPFVKLVLREAVLL